jgi:hypothetical protein
MVGKFKSIFSHKITLAASDAPKVTRACMSALIEQGGVEGNVAIAAEMKLNAKRFKFTKTCNHKKACKCTWKACIPVVDASNARKRSFDEASVE